MKQSAAVLVAVPNTGILRAKTASSLRLAVAEAQKSGVVSRIAIQQVTASPVELARHRLADTFLADPGWTHLFFVDDDMVLPPNAVARLLKHQKPIACFPCPMFAPQPPNGAYAGPSITANIWNILSGSGTANEDRLVRYIEPDEYPTGHSASTFECDATGLACCLIERQVLESLQGPMFAVRFTENGREKRIGEDAYFFERCRERGFRVTVDPTSLCDHLKPIDLTHIEDFFRDEPIRWDWQREAKCEPPEELHLLVARSHPGEILAAQADFLAGLGPEVTIHEEATPHFGTVLNKAMARLLASPTAAGLFILTDGIVPPADFLDRACSASFDAVSGWFREPDESGNPAPSVWQKLDSGWQRVHEFDPHQHLTEPLIVPAVTPRALILRRSLVERLGSDPIPPQATIGEATFALAEAIANCSLDPDPDQRGIMLIPIGCPHIQTLGLSAFLQAKVQIRQQIRRQQGA